jgi:transaldolase
MLPNLRNGGRLHAQTIPSQAYSTIPTILHARRLVSLYQELGNVPVDRVCIKIPSTIAGLRAMQVLEAEGIRTLATTTFCVEQGLAAAEDAKALYIAPYINALEVHF